MKKEKTFFKKSFFWYSFFVKFFFRTLGCKMNALDSARISAALQMAGHTPAKNESEADMIFINSCTVTARADRQSRQEAHKSERAHKKTIIFGCAVRFSPEKWKKDFPKALLFRDERELISYFGISAADLEYSLFDRTRIPIAIQTGCDNLCTFCATRIARGPSRDFSTENILRQIRRAERAGAREIVLTGIQLAGFGCGDTRKFPERTKLPDLLREILTKTTIPRIRMSSLGPQFLNNAFFDVFSDERICDHLHLSIQSGSENILQKMNRGHTAKKVFEIAEKARKIRPRVAICGDFIAGFPFETEKDFEKSAKMIDKIGFAKVHIFPFSPREKTAAAKMPPIDAEIRKNRAKKLREIGRKNRELFCRKNIGEMAEILVETAEKGFSKNYVRVKIPDGKNGELRKVKITDENLVDDFGR